MLFHSLTLAAVAATAAVSAQSLSEVLASTPQLSRLTSLVTQVKPDLLEGANDITLLAPSNDALDRRLRNVNLTTEVIAGLLSYHVVNTTLRSSDFEPTPAFARTLLEPPTFTNVTGGQVVKGALNGSNVTITSGLQRTSNVTQADISFDGGVIHVIDQVLIPPPNIVLTADALGLTGLVQTAGVAGLAPTLLAASDITVFAPTNAAFQAAADALSQLDRAGVARILGAHVVQGTVGYSSGLNDGDVLETLSGVPIEITIQDGAVFANGVRVVVPDVLVANGVVHVIEGILPVPPANGTTNGTTDGVPGPSGTGTGTSPTGSPIATFPGEGAASSLTTGLIQMTALVIGACVFFNA